MSTEALNRIINEVNNLTPQERRELIDRLAHDERNSQEHIDALSNLNTIPDDTGTLREWLNETRNIRAELPLTSDSVDMLRELREVRSRQ